MRMRAHGRAAAGPALAALALALAMAGCATSGGEEMADGFAPVRACAARTMGDFEFQEDTGQCDRCSVVATADGKAQCQRANGEECGKCRPVKTIQFIAADPGMQSSARSSGTGAAAWGIWRLDPGPRGVPLEHFDRDLATGVAPRGWAFDSSEWWIEEYGRIMEAPDMPLPAARYSLDILNGERQGEQTVLTVDTAGAWSLSDGATLADVTHGPCRSAKYTAEQPGALPTDADPADFPVPAGAEMPDIPGCARADYAVLFVRGIEEALEYTAASLSR